MQPGKFSSNQEPGSLGREGDTSVLQEGEHMVGLNDGTPCFGKLGRGKVLDVGPMCWS